MKTLLIGIGAIALAGALWAAIPDGQDLAVSGCCKERVGDSWRRIGGDFESCKKLNKSDEDNIFEPKGNYWWDVGC